MENSVFVSKIAKVYAGALFDTAEESNSLELFKSQMEEILEVLNSSEDLRIVVSNSSIALFKKFEIFESVFAGKIDKKLLNFLKILLEKGRFFELEGIYSAYCEMLAKRSNLKVVEIFSPIKLNFENKSNVLFKLEHKFGCDIRPIWTIDESLIAGLAFKFDDTIIDTSVKAKLKDLEKNITR
ncbi:MAG: ATP synthase F1 subunit delta [Muribaculaceae bacterium]|nr:ATP synthase F1 subunit delta [Muribaculaceae bacterium]